MGVVREIAPRMAPQSESRNGASEEPQRCLVIDIVECHGGARHPAGEDMVHRTWVVEPQGSCHGARLTHASAPTLPVSGPVLHRLPPPWGQTPPPGVRPRLAAPGPELGGSDPAWPRQAPNSGPELVAGPELVGQ